MSVVASLLTVLAVLAVGAPPAGATALGPGAFDPSLYRTPVRPTQLEFRVTDADWTPAQAASAVGFEHRPDGVVVHGSGGYGEPVWVRLRFTNSTDKPLVREVQIETSLIDTVQVWQVTNGVAGPRWSAGEDTELTERVLPHATPRFPVVVPPGGFTTLVLRLHDEGTLVAPLLVGESTAIERRWSTRQVVNGGLALVLGWALGAVLLLALVERRRLLGWLAVAMLGLMGVHLFYFWGVAGDIIPPHLRPYVVNRLNAANAIVVYTALTGFTVQALGLREHHPRLTRALWAVVAALIVNSLLIIFVSYGSFLLVNHFGGLACLALLGVGATLRARRGDAVARILLGVYACQVATGVLLATRTVGVVSAGVDAIFATTVVTFMSLLMAAVYSLSRKLRRERTDAMADRLAEATRNAALSETFERFVPKEFLRLLRQPSIESIAVGQNVERRMSVLFSDIRGFTTMTEGMSPADSFEFINNHLDWMEPVIQRHGGFVDNYIGDAVMALFTADEGTDDVIAAAVEMFGALDSYNAVRATEGLDPVEVGVGVHTGSLILGTIGSAERISATAIGDSVNAASRIEGATKKYGVRLLFSDETVALCGEPKPSTRVVDRVRLKGKVNATTLQEALDVLPAAAAAARRDRLDSWNGAWAAYEAGDFAAAGATFAEHAAADPTDVPAALLADRCQRFVVDPPVDWDGVVDLTSK